MHVDSCGIHSWSFLCCLDRLKRVHIGLVTNADYIQSPDSNWSMETNHSAQISCAVAGLVHLCCDLAAWVFGFWQRNELPQTLSEAVVVSNILGHILVPFLVHWGCDNGTIGRLQDFGPLRGVVALPPSKWLWSARLLLPLGTFWRVYQTWKHVSCSQHLLPPVQTRCICGPPGAAVFWKL